MLQPIKPGVDEESRFRQRHRPWAEVLGFDHHSPQVLKFITQTVCQLMGLIIVHFAI
ncbi:MAG TPA: hypothetical protein VK901_21565 [Nitrospiraceae bacterium]|nr:hypothetical protein [Nitrospiraceae bacterium]